MDCKNIPNLMDERILKKFLEVEKVSNKNGSNEKNRKNVTMIILAGVFIIIALLSVILFLLVSQKRNEEEKSKKRNIVVNENNAESVAAQMAEEAQEYVEPGYYTVSMDTDWHFSKGDAVSDDAWVDNLAENTNDVYFDVFLAENEEEAIYQSPVIPRGSYLEQIALDKPLDKGTYDCVMVYHLVDEEQETISTLRVAFTITVDS